MDANIGRNFAQSEENPTTLIKIPFTSLIEQEHEKNTETKKSYSTLKNVPPEAAAKLENSPKENGSISRKKESVKVKKDRKVLHPQAKEVILNVVNFMKQESNGRFAVSPRKVQCRAAAATGYSERTVRRIVKESRTLCQENSSTEVSFPAKKPVNRPKPKTGLDPLTRCSVRKLIHRIYVNEKTVPTIKKIHQKLVEEIGFKGGSRSAHKIVKDLGFYWKKTTAKNFVLMEKHDIRLKRIEYLREITRFRNESRLFLYIADAVVQGGSTKSVGGIFAGNDSGLIPGSLYLAEGEANLAPHLQGWLCDVVLPQVTPNSVVVLESSLAKNYERVPTLDSDTATMKRWLKAKGIVFGSDMLRPELHQIIKKSVGKMRKSKSLIEKILTDAGHTVCITPVDHSDLNPAVLAWDEIRKSLLDNPAENSDISIRISSIMKSLENWSTFVASVRISEQQYLACEGIVDAHVERVISSKETPPEELDDNINFVRHFMGGLLGIDEQKVYSVQ